MKVYRIETSDGAGPVNGGVVRCKRGHLTEHNPPDEWTTEELGNFFQSFLFYCVNNDHENFFAWDSLSKARNMIVKQHREYYRENGFKINVYEASVYVGLPDGQVIFRRTEDMKPIKTLEL